MMLVELTVYCPKKARKKSVQKKKKRKKEKVLKVVLLAMVMSSLNIYYCTYFMAS